MQQPPSCRRRCCCCCGLFFLCFLIVFLYVLTTSAYETVVPCRQLFVSRTFCCICFGTDCSCCTAALCCCCHCIDLALQLLLYCCCCVCSLMSVSKPVLALLSCTVLVRHHAVNEEQKNMTPICPQTHDSQPQLTYFLLENKKNVEHHLLQI